MFYIPKQVPHVPHMPRKPKYRAGGETVKPCKTRCLRAVCHSRGTWGTSGHLYGGMKV